MWGLWPNAAKAFKWTLYMCMHFILTRPITYNASQKLTNIVGGLLCNKWTIYSSIVCHLSFRCSCIEFRKGALFPAFPVIQCLWCVFVPLGQSRGPTPNTRFLPPATVITDYATGLEKLSVNGQFFVCAHAQLAVSSQRTTESISGVTFVTAHVAYVSSNKTKIVPLET